MAFDGSIEKVITDDERDAGYPSIGGWNPKTRGGPADMAPEDWIGYGDAMCETEQPVEYRKVIEQVATGWEKFMNMIGLGRKDAKSKK